MVETGHFSSWPLMIEIRRPGISSSQTLSPVPAFPPGRITVLPTSSVWACSNSQRIVVARTFTVGMGDPESGLSGSVFAFERCASRDRCAANGCQWNPARTEVALIRTTRGEGAGSRRRALLRWVQIALKPASKTVGLHGGLHTWQGP